MDLPSMAKRLGVEFGVNVSSCIVVSGWTRGKLIEWRSFSMLLPFIAFTSEFSSVQFSQDSSDLHAQLGFQSFFDGTQKVQNPPNSKLVYLKASECLCPTSS